MLCAGGSGGWQQQGQLGGLVRHAGYEAGRSATRMRQGCDKGRSHDAPADHSHRAALIATRAVRATGCGSLLAVAARARETTGHGGRQHGFGAHSASVPQRKDRTAHV
eukprot:6345232-Prymnesium_polylepis.1